MKEIVHSRKLTEFTSVRVFLGVSRCDCSTLTSDNMAFSSDCVTKVVTGLVLCSRESRECCVP